MKIRNINKTIYTNGGTSDIIRVVMMAYDIESDPQIYELAEKLKGSTTVETCKNIWQYLVDNINYKADSDGDNGEMVRTPARLVHDRTGDCKSYSLFTAVILRYLKIPHVFRFVSYSPAKEATHVYCVAFDTEHGTQNTKREIVIDAVAKQQLNYDFGFEKQYNYRCDMANGGTKISYLAGFKPGHKVGKAVGAMNLNTPISGSAIITIDNSLERLQAAYDVNPSDFNREQLNISKLLVHAATTNNLDSYKVSRALYGIAYLSEKNLLSSEYDTLKYEFDNVNYNDITDANIDNELLIQLQNIVLEQKKNSVNGIGSSTTKRKRLEETINAWSAMYFFIWFYSDDEIVSKFNNSTELLKKKKFVGIFIKTIYNETKMVESAFLQLCKKKIESVFGPIAKLKETIESGSNIKMPIGYENYNLPQLVRDNTAKLENVIDIWFYVINDGVIDFSSQMLANVIDIEEPEIIPGGGNTSSGNTSDENTGGSEDYPETPTKSNTGLILGALSALFLLK